MEPVGRSSFTAILGASPNAADMALVSINKFGSPGMFNQLVLKAYGYELSNLPRDEDLVHGFYTLQKDGKKTIIFVVTGVDDDVRSNLQNNLWNTLTEFRGWFDSKTVWLPTMGLTSQKISLEESYHITVGLLNRFFREFPKIQTRFIIHIPDTIEGRNFLSRPGKEIKEEPKHDLSAAQFVESLACDFYLVGAMWAREDQTGRFVESGIWEKGHEDESYAAIINKVRRNDILIIKSTFASDGISYLRVKAVGIVVENLADGATLKVDWRISGLLTDVEHLGSYRFTIAPADIEDVITIFSYIDPNLWQRLLPPAIPDSPETPAPTPIRSSVIAGLLSDSEKGIDYLSIGKDVAAFARVMTAKSFEPPLAVALLGKWGSGKSFFMRKLEEKIIDLSGENPRVYCEGIAHIHFNAWSYMDANLWASIVTTIFDGLYAYISENAKDEEKKNIEKQLGKQLTIAKEELSILENRRSSVASQIETLEARKDTLEEELNTKLADVEKKTLWSFLENANREFGAREKIIQALKENRTFVQTEEKFKELVPENYWDDPKAAYEKIRSRYTFLKEFFSGRKAVWNIVVLVLFITLIAVLPVFIKQWSALLRNANFALPQSVASLLAVLGIGWRRAEATYKKLQPVVASFWTIKEDFDKKIEEAVSQYEQEEKKLKLQIEKNKAELIVVDQQIQQAVALKADLEFRINNALATEALYSFIERRAKSEDYKKHLGIISIIRRDFEILNNLLSGHHKEAKDKEAAEEFRKRFKKPLERIILYVDDLDRCPEENVVEVLEAVNLLMAFPLFVVIVGVDPRWVKNALLKKHALQFSKEPNDGIPKGVESIEPSNYLEKIFQIPFHLKEAGQENVREMIRRLAEAKPLIDTEDEMEDQAPPAPAAREETSAPIMGSSAPAARLPPSAPAVARQAEKDKPIAVEISQKEVLLLEDMGAIIGTNPRTIKRFLNSYRIVKAHEDFSYDSAFEENELLAIMFLLALPISHYKELLRSFEEFIESDNNQDKPISSYLSSSAKLGNDGLFSLKRALNIVLSDKRSYQLLQQEKGGSFLKHNAFIKRFTFKSL